MRISKKIVPSDQTSNAVFENATEFEMKSLNGNFENIAKESGYKIRFVQNINKLDENLPGLPSQRRIIQWIFDENREIGDLKRFDLSFGGYVVLKINDIDYSGIADIEDVRDEIMQVLLNQKKSKLIMEKNSNLNTLEEFENKNIRYCCCKCN